MLDSCSALSITAFNNVRFTAARNNAYVQKNSNLKATVAPGSTCSSMAIYLELLSTGKIEIAISLPVERRLSGYSPVKLALAAYGSSPPLMTQSAFGPDLTVA